MVGKYICHFRKMTAIVANYSDPHNIAGRDLSHLSLEHYDDDRQGYILRDKEIPKQDLGDCKTETIVMRCKKDGDWYQILSNGSHNETYQYGFKLLNYGTQIGGWLNCCWAKSVGKELERLHFEISDDDMINIMSECANLSIETQDEDTDKNYLSSLCFKMPASDEAAKQFIKKFHSKFRDVTVAVLTPIYDVEGHEDIIYVSCDKYFHEEIIREKTIYIWSENIHFQVARFIKRFF